MFGGIFVRSIFKKSLVLFFLFSVLLTANNPNEVELLTNSPFQRSAVPHLTRTNDNTLHLVLCQNENNGSVINYLRSQDNGLTWSTPRNLAAKLSFSKTPLLLSGGSKLQTILEDTGAIYITESLDNGKEWSQPFKVSGTLAESKNPAATIAESGDIHLVWENAGSIFYRLYSRSTATWSTIYSISKANKAAGTPVISNVENKIIIVAWVEQGTIVARELNLANGSWLSIENVSIENSGGVPALCRLPVISVDAAGIVHALWVKEKQIFHRTKIKGYWSPIVTKLSDDFLSSFSEPSLVCDNSGYTYAAFIEKNSIFVQRFDSKTLTWKIIRKLKPTSSKLVFSPLLGGNTSKNNYLSGYSEGYDLLWVEKDLQTQAATSLLRFNSKAVLAKATSAPELLSVQNNNGHPYLVWQTTEQQTAYQLVINDRLTPKEPLLYDSKKVSSPLQTQIVETFSLQAQTMYFFIRVLNEKGVWSEWSQPYSFVTDKDLDGPLIEITSIDEDSLFMHSPDTATLYYGTGLEEPKEFVIRGKAIDNGSGIKKLVFSPAFGDQPPPLYNLAGEEWAVRYSISSSDEPGSIIITAYDNVGHTTSKIISVLKDTNPPDAPTWVKIYPDQNKIDLNPEEIKTDNDRTVYVTWVDGSDSDSGVRYHLMGTSAKWWQNSIHRSGDAEDGDEGDNTFYVFAVDNVGNVSEAGTDKIFIDSIAPTPPALISQTTSTNYFYGTCDNDVKTILVNGVTDEIEILEKTSWRYKHKMRDGQSDLYSFIALDHLGNKSLPTEVRLFVDKTPPNLFYVDHNFEEKPLRYRDKLVVTLKGEPKNTAFFKIEGLTEEIEMYDDGTRGDITANDAIYTGSYFVDTELTIGKKEIIGRLTDQTGNSSIKKALSAITIDSSVPVLIDDFENKGDLYPWKNHCRGKNIIRAEAPAIRIPENNGCLKIDYDLAGEQAWAGLSSKKFIPKNLAGSHVYLTFWLKGSGSENSRLFISLQGKNKRNVVADFYTFEKKYSIPLNNQDWQKVTLPIPVAYLEDLDQVTTYHLYVFSDNEQDKGTVYIDDLRTVYVIDQHTGNTFSKQSAGILPTTQTDNAPAIRKIATEQTTAFIDSPYIQPELYPNPLKKNQKAEIKVALPQNIDALMVYIHWGEINNEGQKTKLEKAANNVWKGSYDVPNNIGVGENFGHLYIRSKENRFYKKKFVYKVIDETSSNYDKITVIFTPHPIITKTGIQVKVLVPKNIAAENVMLFFGENKENVYSVKLEKNSIIGENVYWLGKVILPADVKPGDYTAFVYLKTRDGKFVKKRTKYSVIN